MSTPAGDVVQIFPNRHVASGDARFIDKGKPVSIPDPTNPTYRGLTGFRALEPLGRGRLIAIVAPQGRADSDIVEEPQRMTKGFAPEGRTLVLSDESLRSADSRSVCERGAVRSSGR